MTFGGLFLPGDTTLLLSASYGAEGSIICFETENDAECIQDDHDASDTKTECFDLKAALGL